MTTPDYQGQRRLDPACADDYAPKWKVTCDNCGSIFYVRGEKPDQCERCLEDDYDVLTIRQVPA